MPPHAPDRTCTGVLNEDDIETADGALDRDIKPLLQRSELPNTYLWPNMAVFAVAHLLGALGLYHVFTSAQLLTTLWTFALYNASILGITAGVHRLWSHRAYKARLPLRLLLVLFSSIAHQNSVIHWAREHRVHHKYSETNADPVNASRGFFYSHVGWLLVKKHPDVQKKGGTVDISDLTGDWLLAWQRRHYVWCTLVASVAVPWAVPVWYWGESVWTALCVAVMLRWVCSLNATWLVNSAAHMFGQRPYDERLNPSENWFVALVTLGEGFHNFHHVFPWDYKTSEWGNGLNGTKWFLDWCGRLGLAYDMKTVSKAVVGQRMARTGDGTRNVWGWGDVDQLAREREEAVVEYRRQKK